MTSPVTLAAICAALATPALADPAGYRALSITTAHHTAPVTGAMWYPAGDGGAPLLFADNPVFAGMEVLQDADLAPGRHPVVLLSHGFGGGVESLAWLGTGLAARGAVVVAVNHPNTTWRDFDIDAGAQHWSRPQDLSAALDQLARDPDLAGHLDLDAVMAAGFSYGGWTALALGGARSDQAGFVAHCDEYGATSSYCDALARSTVDVTGLSEEDWNASYADPRVDRVVAIDPGFVWNVPAEALADTVADVHLVGFGAGADRLLATDFDASGFAALMPAAEVTRIVPAVHFTGMPPCKPAGEAILLAEEDDPVCTDPEGTDRRAVHEALIDLIAQDLGL